MPLVIDRDLRTEYINALEAADGSDLAPLATLMARLERTAILQALSIDVDAELSHARSITGAVIESLAAKFNKRREQRHAEYRGVNQLAQALRAHSRKTIETAIQRLEDPVSIVGEPQIHMTEGGPDRANAHWYKVEVVESGRGSGKFINFAEAHYFLKASIRVGRERLVFVVSFHHVGRELSGIVEVTAFARLESFEDSEDREFASRDFFLCSLEPFVITWQTEEAEARDAFDRWLDAALAIAIKEFGDRL